MIDRIICSLGYAPASELRKVESDLRKADVEVATLNRRHQSHIGHVAALNKILSQTLEERDRYLAELTAAKATHAEAIAVRDREIARLSQGQKPRSLKKIAAALRQPRDGRGFAKRA